MVSQARRSRFFAPDPVLPNVNWLLPQAYDVSVTNLRKPAFNDRGASAAASGATRNGPVMSNDLPFSLVANEPYNLAAGNPYRVGMMLQNCDPTNNMFYSFGAVATPNSKFLTPGQTLLLDFVCPCDSVWALATVALSGVFTEMVKSEG